MKKIVVALFVGFFGLLVTSGCGSSSPTVLVASLTQLSALPLTGACSENGLAFDECTDLAWVGSYLYAADRHSANSGTGGQVLIVNAINPGAPALLPGFSNPGVQGLFASGNKIFTGGYFSTYFSIFNVSNNAAVTTVGTISNMNYDKPAVNGNYAYSTQYGGVVKVFDISNPATPSVLGSLTLSVGNMLPNIYSGGYLYVAGKKATNNLQIVNVQTPTSPVLAGALTLGGSAGGMSSLAISGNYLYAALCDNSPTNSLVVVDISNPAIPTIVHTTVLSPNPCDSANTGIRGGLAIKDHYIFVGTDSLRLFDIAAPTQPVLLQTGLPGEMINAVSLNARYLAAMSGSSNNVYFFDAGY